jgi:hypothetical protein
MVDESGMIRNYKIVKSYHGPQEGVRHQDERTDWPSVVKELDFDYNLAGHTIIVRFSER